jgi:transposase
LHKLGEDVTETLELIPRQWKLIQHVREKFSCRSCETITQPPAPSHPISRGRAGSLLLAHLLFAKYGLHLPLNRQSNVYAREGIDLDVSTLADWVGACAATLMPLVETIRGHVFAAERIHADDTTVPVQAKGKTRTVGYGPMCATMGRSAGPIRRPPPSSTRATAPASMPSSIWRAMPA